MPRTVGAGYSLDPDDVTKTALQNALRPRHTPLDGQTPIREALRHDACCRVDIVPKTRSYRFSTSLVSRSHGAPESSLRASKEQERGES